MGCHEAPRRKQTCQTFLPVGREICTTIVSFDRMNHSAHLLVDPSAATLRPASTRRSLEAEVMPSHRLPNVSNLPHSCIAHEPNQLPAARSPSRRVRGSHQKAARPCFLLVQSADFPDIRSTAICTFCEVARMRMRCFIVERLGDLPGERTDRRRCPTCPRSARSRHHTLPAAHLSASCFAFSFSIPTYTCTAPPYSVSCLVSESDYSHIFSDRDCVLRLDSSASPRFRVRLVFLRPISSALHPKVPLSTGDQRAV